MSTFCSSGSKMCMMFDGSTWKYCTSVIVVPPFVEDPLGDTIRAIDVTEDGAIYAATQRTGSPLASVFKFSPDGTTIDATYDTGATARGVAVGASGNVWVVGDTAGGAVVWVLDSDLGFVASVALGGRNDALYVRAVGSDVYVATRTDGGSDPTVLFKFTGESTTPTDVVDIANSLVTDFAFQSNGRVAVARERVSPGNLFTVNLHTPGNSTPIWRYNGGAGAGASGIAVDGDDHVYTAKAGTPDQWVKLDGATGSELWSVNSPSNSHTVNRIVIAADGNPIFAGFFDAGSATVYKLDKTTGATIWSFDTGDSNATNLAAYDIKIDTNGGVYLVGDRNTSYPGGAASLWHITDPPS